MNRARVFRESKKLRRPFFESLEERRLLANWTNPDQPLDVSADNWVGPQDVLHVIYQLNINAAEPNGNGLGQAGVAPFLDVNMDGIASPIDALLIVNNLNYEKPLVFTMLQNDTAVGGGSNDDRRTADASIHGWIQFYQPNDQIFIGWDITDDRDLKDVSSYQTANTFAIREQTITQLLGQPLTSGSHTLTIVLKRATVERFRSTWSFTVDRSAV